MCTVSLCDESCLWKFFMVTWLVAREVYNFNGIIHRIKNILPSNVNEMNVDEKHKKSLEKNNFLIQLLNIDIL